jgi:dihydropyrimidine dehydrogenase (NAD+) subunit PreT
VRQGVPTHIDIPQFIRKIATGNLKGSARTIFDANILGMSCARVCPVEVLCVGDCVYNELGVPPIQIGKLQRYSTDEAFEKGWRFFQAGKDTGKSVGLVGAGPASLACAHELRRHGHRCTIYEKRATIGGLNTTGVAPYKMKADRSLEEAKWILGIGGIEVKTGVSVGDDVSLEELDERHDAVFVGIGLGADSKLGVPSEDLPGIHGAVEWIEKMKLGKVPVEGISGCVVIGGGNTALDAVREARGLGIPRVTMIYRGTEEKMSGYAHEWKAAQIEGGRAEWHLLPVAFEGKGKVEHVRCVRVDASKKPIPGSEVTLAAELVLVAIGQSRLGRLERKGWFSGGDCHNGGKEVVNAAAEGKAAALAIQEYLTHA